MWHMKFQDSVPSFINAMLCLSTEAFKTIRSLECPLKVMSLGSSLSYMLLPPTWIKLLSQSDFTKAVLLKCRCMCTGAPVRGISGSRVGSRPWCRKVGMPCHVRYHLPVLPLLSYLTAASVLLHVCP